MVIKTLSRKAKNLSFHNLIHYVNRQEKQKATMQLFDPNFRIYHNLQDTDTNAIISEFKENLKYKSYRKGGVGAYHEILSFKHEDSQAITQGIIEDLAHIYIQKRSPKGLAYGAVHTDKDHIHLHLVISSNQLMSKRANRLTQEQFLEVRKYIEDYQKTKYPNLKSIVYDDLKLKKELRQEQDKNTRKERLKKLEGRGVSHKQLMQDLLVKSMTSSNNPQKFHNHILKEKDTNLYVYRNKVTGVIYGGRKYRFSTLIKSIENETEKEMCLKKLETFRRLGLLQQVREQEQDLNIDNDLDLSL